VHELGLLRGVVDAVVAVTAEKPVSAVGVKVGSLSGAVPEALEGAWPIAVAGTPLAGAKLELELIPAAIWCPGCQAEQPIDEFYALTCPVCGTPSGQLVRGREFAVAWAET
jgi:hydrogenase nickel incorporation protein HypA/HybF